MMLLNYLFGWKKWGIKKGDFVLELGSGGSPMVRSNILLDKYIYDDSERELNITRDSQKKPVTEEWKMYDEDGVTVVETVTDTITYSGPFEISRTRTIS